MSAELSPRLAGEARRQLRICNACRYCEGYCSAFPAITRLRAFADADIARIANLCHNCRGCYYACQYTAPHEFDLNLPAILAEARRESWQGYIRPRALGRLFHTNGWATVAATLAGFVLIWLAIRWLGGQEGGGGFYAALSHSAMVALFLPAFLLPLAGLGLGLAAFWREIGGRPLRRREIGAALAQAARLQDLSGGQGQGCNFERAERYSNARRHAHHAVLWGFLLCFAATVAGTVMHYGLGQPAPYHLWSVPKLLGIPGGVLLLFGTLAMLGLKRRADPALGDAAARGGEDAFTALLALVAASGLALWALGGTALMPALLALHLGSVLSFFLLMPFTKMAHGFFRLAALMRDAQERG